MFDMHCPNNMMGPLALREQKTKNVKKTDRFCTVKLKKYISSGERTINNYALEVLFLEINSSNFKLMLPFN